MSATTGTALRPSWEELPDRLRDGLDSLVGGVMSAQTQTGGFTPGLAVRLCTQDGEQVFAKGISADHVLAGKYQDEASTARQLPEATPAPRLRWADEIGGWIVLVFDDIDACHADLSPGSADIGRVVAAVGGLSDVLTPCPVPTAPPAAVELADLVHGWRELAADAPLGLDDWAQRHLGDLAELEVEWLSAADGKTLLHGDINPSNLLIAGDGTVSLVDWAQPACGAAWIDVADLVPHLVLAGHTPTAAEDALADVPAWHGTDPEAITSYAAAFAGYWARMSRRPVPPGVPHLRNYQARAARAALTWAAHRTGWS